MRDNFLSAQRFRGVIVLLLTFTFTYYILNRYVVNKEIFTLNITYSQLHWLQQILLISTLTAFFFIVKNKIFKFFSSIRLCFYALHGFTLGLILGLGSVFYTKIVAFLDLNSLTCTLIIPSICVVFFLVFFLYALDKKKLSQQRTQPQDSLDYSERIREIAKYLCNESKTLPNDEKANKIAIIYGKNGAGKSFSLKMLEFELEKNNKRVTWFYPSYYTSEIMKEEFFKHIEKMITKEHYLPGISFFSGSFSNLVKVGEKSFRFSGLFESCVRPLIFGKPIEISEALSYYTEENKDIVLFIDETDRCSTEQIEALISVLRNLGNSIGFSIVITFTYEMESIVKKNFNCLSRETIFEKIAQKYYPLPSLSQKHILKLWKAEVEPEIYAFTEELFTPLLCEILNTPRLLQLFKSKLYDFYSNFPAFKNFSHNLIFFLHALAVACPKTFHDLTRVYFLLEKEDIEHSGEISKLISNSLSSDLNLSEIFINNYAKDITLFSERLQERAHSALLRAVFTGTTLHRELLEVDIEDIDNYKNTFANICSKIREEKLLLSEEKIEFDTLQKSIVYTLNRDFANHKASVYRLLKYFYTLDDNALYFGDILDPLNHDLYVSSYKHFRELQEQIKDSKEKNILESYSIIKLDFSTEEIYKSLEKLYKNDECIQLFDIIKQIKSSEVNINFEDLLSYSKNESKNDSLPNLLEFLYNIDFLTTSSCTFPQTKNYYEMLTRFFENDYTELASLHEVLEILVQQFHRMTGLLLDPKEEYYKITIKFYNNIINKNIVANYFLLKVIFCYFHYIENSFAKEFSPTGKIYANFFIKLKEQECSKWDEKYKELHKVVSILYQKGNPNKNNL